MTTPETLFADYNNYRLKTAHFQSLTFRRTLRATSKRLRLFQSLLLWCDQYRVDPRRWLYSLFAVRKWRFAPKLEAPHLMSENHLPKYRKMDLTCYDEERHEQSLVQKDIFDPNRDLSAGVERLKILYQQRGNGERCLNLIETETYGYHPKSVVCRCCALRTECLERLRDLTPGFDVLALRNGKITVSEAQIGAAARGSK